MSKQIVPLFDPTKPNVGKLLEPHSGILYWDEHPAVFYELYSKLTQQFWTAHEVSLTSDSSDWVSKMTDRQKELFKRGIGQLVVLDSLACVADGAMSDYIKNPAAKTLLVYIASQEAIHNESYTYACTTFMTKEEADEVFERPKKDPRILAATEAINRAFIEFQEDKTPATLAMALVAMIALEGIRFTNGFVPFYYLNRNHLMLGTGKIINFINKDEAQHSYSQIQILKKLMADYPELNTPEFTQKTYDFFKDVVQKEQDLVDSIYEGITDIDVVEVKMYVEWRANMLLANMGLDKIFPTQRNPMRWISVFDPEMINNRKGDFFEEKLNNYSRTSAEKNGFDDL